MINVYEQRLARLRAALQAAEMQCLLVSTPTNMRYLSGFTGSYGALLVSQDAAVLISDFRYRFQAAEQAPGFRFVEIQRWVPGVAGAIRELGCATIGFESAHLTYQTHAQMAAELEGARLLPTEGAVEKLRMVKDAGEIRRIEHAADISSAAVEYVLSLVRPGVSERELALAAEDYIRKEAGADLAFDPIVASGARAAQCHAEPGARELATGDMVVMDVGAKWEGYGADITRTVAVGAANAQQREIYSVCWRAQNAALNEVKAGANCAALDHTARSIIDDAGHGESFGHGLGHGVGLDTHELPRLTRGEDVPLSANMTTTVEPGIYKPEVGGVRLEDLILVTLDGCRVLTHAAKPPELPVL
jgi:Xaa-Pro aminopeptidase